MISAILLLGLLAEPMPEPVEHASADDCAIIAEVGKQKGWGSDFFAEYDGKRGGTYIQDCNWKEFGLGDPPRGTRDSKSGLQISRPRYNWSRTRATTVREFFIKPSFIVTDQCRLRKIKGRWRLVSCDQISIS